MGQKLKLLAIKMEPKQKLNLLILAVSVPNICAVLGIAIGHYRPPEWLIRLWLGCSLIGVVCVFVYMFRHPELRPSPAEKAKRLARVNPRTARMWTSIFFLASIAVGVAVLAQRDPLSHAWRHGVTPNPVLISLVRSVAWFSLVASFAGLIRLGQVWYRNRKTTLANDHDDFK